MASHRDAYQRMNNQRSADASNGSPDYHYSQQHHVHNNSSGQYASSSGYRLRQINLEGFNPSSNSKPPSSSLELSQQTQRRTQDALPYGQNSSRSDSVPNSAVSDLKSDGTYSQPGSDSHVSSSTTFDSLTPISSASSQMLSRYGPSSTSTSHRPSVAQKQRYWLHIRQQPRAGRACSNGRDRRAVDPPPVVQLQISDFDPNSPDDMEDMQDQSFIVHCLLSTAAPPKRDISILMCQDDSSSGAMRAEKQINGNLDASPFFCHEDPDPDTAPQHPSSQLYCPLPSSPNPPPPPNSMSRTNLPATFFYFADLSIRRAGVYRLEFQLMRVRTDQQPFPVLHSVLSEPFNVVNAKDFDHVQPSTPLVRGLVASGAGFPLKLKQGSRAHRTSPEEYGDGSS